MQTTTATLGTLIDGALFELEGASERARPVVIGSTALATVSDIDFTMSSGEADVSDVIEFGSELVLITSKSNDATPVYRCSRGYYSTTKAAQPEGTVGIVNPPFQRRRVADAINRCLTRLEALGVPLVVGAALSREPGLRYIELPEGVRRVLQVLYVNETSGRVMELDGWRVYSSIDTALTASGQVLHLPLYVVDDDELQVVYQTPYQWSTSPAFPDETATVTLPIGAQDLPASYAAAWLVSAREVSRQELDRSEEWGRTEMLRGGGSAGLVRAKWQEFYRALDEAQRVVSFEVPKHRPYVKAPRVRL